MYCFCEKSAEERKSSKAKSVRPQQFLKEITVFLIQNLGFVGFLIFNCKDIVPAFYYGKPIVEIETS